MAGALAERDFAKKLDKAGFVRIEIVHRQAVSVDMLTRYPLFTEELLALMRHLIPEPKHEAVATAIVVTATRR